MRKLTLFLTSVAFLSILGTSAFGQPEKICLKWLQNQLKVYNAHYVPGEGLKGSSFNYNWNWGMPSMPTHPMISVGLFIEEAWFDSETKKCRIKGFNAVSHSHAYDDSTYYHTNGLRPGKDCYKVISSIVCSEFETLPNKNSQQNIPIASDETPKKTILVSNYGPCYTKQQPADIYLFERDFYWGEIPVPNAFTGTATPIWGVKPPKPKIYSTSNDHLDNSKNKGYPALVKKVKIGSTDSLGKFDIEFTLNKNQHILFGGKNGETGYDLRQLFVQDYKEHPSLLQGEKGKDSILLLKHTLTDQHPDYLFYNCYVFNGGDCDVMIKNITPAYGFMKALPTVNCGIVSRGSYSQLLVYFRKDRKQDITDEAFTLFVSTDKGTFSFSAKIDSRLLK